METSNLLTGTQIFIYFKLITKLVLNKVKDQLNKKGAETIRSTGKFF